MVSRHHIWSRWRAVPTTRQAVLGGVAALLCVAMGCAGKAEATAEKDSAAQLKVAEPAAEAEAHKAAEAPVADDFKHPDGALVREADKPEPLEFEWFRGADALPETHPCHDATPVVRAQYNDPTRQKAKRRNWDFELSTLGELSKTLGGDWVHFGPREVRGVRWTDPTGEYLVATCNMGGSGYAAFRGIDDIGGVTIPQERAKFIIGYVGEANSIQRGGLRRMQRTPDGGWKSLDETVLWSNNDESNVPQFVALAELLTVEDSDVDGQPEVAAFTVHDAVASDEEEARALCPEDTPTYGCWYFVVDIIARQGDAELAQRVSLRADGSQARVDEALRPETMDDATFVTLSRVIEAHANTAVAQARAALSEAKKLDVTGEP